MLDHVFTDAIGALRDVFEAALLERQAFEERFHVDVLLGDMLWETSYGLPGEGLPPRVQADITLLWPTWSQTAYRTWYQGDTTDELPRIDIEIVVRIQRLAKAPELVSVLAALPAESPPIGTEKLQRSGPTVEAGYTGDLDDDPEYAFEVSYEGSYELDERCLEDGSILDDHFSAMGGWISSTLVRMGDMPLDFLPPLEDG
jgi:hypothetical protein